MWQFYTPRVSCLTPVFHVSVLPPVSDSPSFPSAKLEEWRAINKSNFSPAISPLVNGVDKPHLEPEAKYTQVKKPPMLTIKTIKPNQEETEMLIQLIIVKKT